MTEQEQLEAVPLSDSIDRFIQRITLTVGWAFVLLIFVIILQVVLRKGFSSGLIALEELQWHLYAMAVMFGLAYAQTTNSHIRVDLFYSSFRKKTKHIVEIFGILFLVMPFIIIIFLHSIDFVHEAWRMDERSSSPSGLPYRWAVKAIIPASFSLLGLAMISRLIRDTTLLLRGER